MEVSFHFAAELQSIWLVRWARGAGHPTPYPTDPFPSSLCEEFYIPFPSSLCEEFCMSDNMCISCPPAAVPVYWGPGGLAHCFNRIFFNNYYTNCPQITTNFGKMLYLPKTYLTQLEPIYFWQTLVPKGGELASTWGKTIVTYMKNVCVHSTCVPWGKFAHCRVVAKGYLRWRAWVSFRTSSQMRSSLYIPRFLLRDGWLTWINMACLVTLATLYTSLPIMDKQYTLMECPVYWL